MDESENLAVLVAHWFVTALERVLEEGLARDYRQHRDELTAVRGRVLPLNTARLFYRGRGAAQACRTYHPQLGCRSRSNTSPVASASTYLSTTSTIRSWRDHLHGFVRPSAVLAITSPP